MVNPLKYILGIFKKKRGPTVSQLFTFSTIYTVTRVRDQIFVGH